MISSTKLFFLVAFLLLVATACNRHPKTEMINHIQERFNAINNDKTLQKISLDAEDFLNEAPDGGAELIGYFKGDSLLKIRVSIGVSYCMRDYDYYMENGRPIFIYETELDYPVNAMNGSMDYDNLKLTFEGRYYLQNGKAINLKCTGKKEVDEQPTPVFVNHLVGDVDGYARHLRGKLKKSVKIS